MKILYQISRESVGWEPCRYMGTDRRRTDVTKVMGSFRDMRTRMERARSSQNGDSSCLNVAVIIIYVQPVSR